MTTSKLSLLFPAALLAVACGPPPAAKEPTPTSIPVAPAPAATDDTGTGIPYTPSLDPTAMDRKIDPCVDFYEYACGGWIKNNPIPADQSAWNVYLKMGQDNALFLRKILEDAGKPGPRDPVTQKIGDFYAACMDEKAVDARGADAIKGELAEIAGIKSKEDLAQVVAHLQLITGDPAFSGGSAQDPDNSDAVIAEIDQGGIGLPDRDYYVKDDPKSKETREKYVEHVGKVFELLGEKPGTAKEHAAAVMRMETALAKASWTNVEERDPYKLKHKMDLAKLKALAPDFDWSAYFAAVEAPAFKVLNVSTPQFLVALDKLITSESLDDWKAYLRFHLADALGPYLSAGFVQEDFAFHGAYLRGAKQIQPRWKRCVQLVNYSMGEAVGQAYVKAVFSDATKQSTNQMVKYIEEAMAERVKALDWMSPETKAKALEKLHAVHNKVGFPDKWRDYSSVTMSPTDLAADVRTAIAFESRRGWNKIGKPVDRNEWQMSPQTVNAEYTSQNNDINFPAGVLQPPLYDAKLDDAPNYGNTGGTIGHELTHGFDDEGRQYDAKGNLVDWWTKKDAAEFEKRVKCVSDQYSSYIAVDDVHVNGELTLGENVADLGGELLAWDAWKRANRGIKLKAIDGLSPDQRFFVGFAQWACSGVRPESARLMALTNPHAPEKTRVNGVVVNMPEFANAFSCKQGQPMVKPADQVCKVW